MTISGSDVLLGDRINPWTRGLVSDADLCQSIFPASKGCGCRKDQLQDYVADVYADGGVITVDSRQAGNLWKPGTTKGALSQSRLLVENALPKEHVSRRVPEVWDEDTDMPPYVDAIDFPWSPGSMEAMPRALAVEKRGGYGDEFREFSSSTLSMELRMPSGGTGSDPGA